MYEHDSWTTPMARDAVVKAAREEYTRLLERFWQVRGFRDLKALHDLLRHYGEVPPDPFDVDPAKLQTYEAQTKTEQIISETRRLLSKDYGFVPLATIRAHLEAQGIEIGGTDKNSNLSAYLSQSGEFIGKRGKGWKLKPQKKTEAPALADAPESEKP